MSRHYILDGYNVLHSDRRESDLSRDKLREQFLRAVDRSKPTGSPNNSVTVVLDGYAAALEGMRLASVRLVFSGDRDADTVIKEMVAGHKNPRDVVVVTNDKGIRAVVKRSGAEVLSSEDFFLLQGKGIAGSKKEKPDAQSMDSVNRELKKLWKLD